MKKIFIYVLGTAQDGGYPHIACNQNCCQEAWKNPEVHRFPSSLALVDMNRQKYWLFDITPEVKSQIHMLNDFGCSLAGVFITHAHIGHYMGLVNFGLEVLNTDKIPVYTMPRMRDYIENNSMLKQLIDSDNIELISLLKNNILPINSSISINAFEVPHRNELSETVGFEIIGNKKSAVYLPDIDSWDTFEDNLVNLVDRNDILFVDGTFYSKDEIKNRNIEKIPHPEILDSMRRFSNLSSTNKKKLYFTHFNHTNYILRNDKEAYNNVVDLGFSIAEEGQTFSIN